MRSPINVNLTINQDRDSYRRNALGDMIARWFCKLFHIWEVDDHSLMEVVYKNEPEKLAGYKQKKEESPYQDMFCPVCQLHRTQLKTNVNFWQRKLF